MKFLCDECIEKSIVNYLRNKNLDVKYIREISRGMKDINIIQMGVKEKRIIITNDKDFGEIVFRLNFKTFGMILLRLDEKENYGYYIWKILKKYQKKLFNSFITIGMKKVRIRKL